jgi:hypothetical protein
MDVPWAPTLGTTTTYFNSRSARDFRNAAICHGEIKQNYDRISRTHFPGGYFYPDQMSFANSDALFATGDLSAAIGREYKGTARLPVSASTHPGRSCKPVLWSFATCFRTEIGRGVVQRS